MVEADRERVAEMTVGVGVFKPSEIPVAMEVFDAATGFGRSVDSSYESAGVEVDGILQGWACWGKVPGTESTFDLYWIVVDRSSQGQGLGGRLLREMYQRIQGRGGLVVVETSGRDSYAATRAFYQRHGYGEVGFIRGYYGPGDDQVIFAKELK